MDVSFVLSIVQCSAMGLFKSLSIVYCGAVNNLFIVLLCTVALWTFLFIVVCDVMDILFLQSMSITYCGVMDIVLLSVSIACCGVMNIALQSVSIAYCVVMDICFTVSVFCIL